MGWNVNIGYFELTAQGSVTKTSSIVYNAFPNLREGSLNQSQKYVGLVECLDNDIFLILGLEIVSKQEKKVCRTFSAPIKKEKT